MSIILASASPRRKQLLEDARLSFDIIVADTKELYPEDLAIAQVPEYIAREKALAVWAQLSAAQKKEEPIIIAADTVVVLDQEIIGKPKDAADAQHILQKLSGRTHQVITGVYLIKGTAYKSFSSTTEVTFNPLNSAQIDYYIKHYKPFDKAGAYAIQEWIGLVGVAHISGDIYNVIGLPVNKVLQALEVWE
ncbi:septum formation protein Maf [Taibaiella sp. KBW10]|uniref:Maf family protein n=1 Tax=Taibaiella sp. KBW10 TaxID=2153357 RepID=UPI000F5A4F11|nr:Maf family protein [Taibaiella sp. KBW10]RQO32296.1 septum formation protein Maf [Taibaiella sp. KBW10]